MKTTFRNLCAVDFTTWIGITSLPASATAGPVLPIYICLPFAQITGTSEEGTVLLEVEKASGQTVQVELHLVSDEVTGDTVLAFPSSFDLNELTGQAAKPGKIQCFKNSNPYLSGFSSGN